MARLYDRMMVDGYTMFGADAVMYEHQKRMAALDGATVFACDNVAEYWHAIGGANAVVKDIERQVPKTACPVSPAFLEATEVGNAKVDVRRFGALVLTHDLRTDEGRDILASPAMRPASYGLRHTNMDGVQDTEGGEWREDTRFLLESWLFYEPQPGGLLYRSGGRPALLGVYYQPTTDSGAPIFDGRHPLRRSVSMASTKNPKEAASALTSGMYFLLQLYLAISFMHCKNVEHREEVPSYLERTAWKKKHRRRLVRYHVLDIDPMRKVLDDDGGARTHGIGRALHICRGHFATYTEDAPLFGRHTGTFWKPQHVRGSAKSGVVVKDYRLSELPIGAVASEVGPTDG